jgi:hypothetical protein
VKNIKREFQSDIELIEKGNEKGMEKEKRIQNITLTAHYW